MKTFVNNTKLLFVIVLLYITNNSISQLTPQGAYLMGNNIEVGINNNGYEGTWEPAFFNHSRSNSWGESYYGFVANPQLDGWANYDGDFFTPGSPENGFGIEINGVNYSNNCSGWPSSEIPGTLSNYQHIGNCKSVQWNGTINNVAVQIVYHMVTTDLFYTTEVTLTNNTGVTLNNVYYYRNLDPDNNVMLHNNYVTENTIVAQPTPACPKALVSAYQPDQIDTWGGGFGHESYMALAAIDEDVRVCFGGFSNRIASDIWNGVSSTWDTFYGNVGDFEENDIAIALAYRISTFAPGETKTFKFAVILDETQIDAAFSNLYEFSYTGSTSTGSVCETFTDEATTCAGIPVTIEIAGPNLGDYNWVWSPATGLSTTTGPIVDASPTVTTVYTVTGTPINPCLAMIIEKTIIVNVSGGPDVEIIDPGPQCGDFDLTTLVINDLNNVPGTTTTFHSSIPDSSTQVSNLWPSTIMNNGDVVYVMIGDPVGGCFDYEQVIIDFSGGGNAGNDYVGNYCNTDGIIDLNTLLSPTADAGGIFSETSAASGQFNAATGEFDLTDLPDGIHTFIYVVIAPAPCINDTALFTINITSDLEVGPDNSTTLCNSLVTPFNLNTLLSATADVGGIWSETSATPSGAFTAGTGMLNVNGLAAGTYTFDYNIAGCLPKTATMTVVVNNQFEAGNDNTFTICNVPGETINLNTLLSASADAGGTWTETTAVPSGQFNAATGILDANAVPVGDYTFTYSFAGTAPCLDDAATFTVSVVTSNDAGADNVATLCNGSSTPLNLNTLLVGADAGGTWSEITAVPSGQFTVSTGAFNPIGLTPGIYTFNYTVAGCADDIATMNITVNQQNSAGPAVSSAICNVAGSNVNLNTLILGTPGGTWVETTVTPSGQFNMATGLFDASGLNVGLYTFEYTVNSTAPCLPTTAIVTINVVTIPNAGADNSDAICNSPGSFYNLNTLLDPTSDFGGSWTSTSPIAPGTFNSLAGVVNTGGLAAGNYTFNYTVPGSAVCPGDAASFTLTVIQEPYIHPLNNLIQCNAYVLPNINGSNLSGNQAYYTESNGNGTQYNAGTVLTNSINLFMYDETGTTPNCYTEVAANIIVNYPPVIEFVADDTIGCEPFQVMFTNTTATATQNCIWNFGDGSTASGCSTVSHTYNTPGVYTVTLSAYSAQNCFATVTKVNYITVTPQAIAMFGMNPLELDVTEPTINTNNSSLFADSYTWYFGDGATSTATNPTHTFPTDPNVTYEVTLIANSLGGCHDTLVKYITVNDIILFYIPNTFTPDGDAFNQTFMPVFTSGYDPFDFHMMIFNRWGELIFESYNASVGWDGTYLGTLIEDGTYVWKIEFKETMSDKRHVHNGSINILK